MHAKKKTVSKRSMERIGFLSSFWFDWISQARRSKEKDFVCSKYADRGAAGVFHIEITSKLWHSRLRIRAESLTQPPNAAIPTIWIEQSKRRVHNSVSPRCIGNGAFQMNKTGDVQATCALQKNCEKRGEEKRTFDLEPSFSNTAY